MDYKIELLTYVANMLQPDETVGIVEIDRRFTVSTCGDMVKSAGKL